LCSGLPAQSTPKSKPVFCGRGTLWFVRGNCPWFVSSFSRDGYSFLKLFPYRGSKSFQFYRDGYSFLKLFPYCGSKSFQFYRDGYSFFAMGNNASGKKGQQPSDWRDVDYETLMKNKKVRFGPRGFLKELMKNKKVRFGPRGFLKEFLSAVRERRSSEGVSVGCERKKVF